MEIKQGIAAVMVLYNKEVRSTETFQSLLKHSTFPILIYDNSPNAQLITNKQIDYFHNPANPGVSMAYNYAIQWAQKKNCSHLLLLDSDSTFPEEAFKEYQLAITSNASTIILPSMISANRKISPFYFKWGKSWYGEAILPDEIPLGRIVAINSGMLIPIELLEKAGGFNEELPLDWSDIEFLRRVSKTQTTAVHISMEVKHDLSEHEKPNLESAKYRYRHYLGGIRIVSSNFGERLLMLFWAKMKAIKFCLKYTTLWFLIYYIRRFHA